MVGGRVGQFMRMPAWCYYLLDRKQYSIHPCPLKVWNCWVHTCGLTLGACTRVTVVILSVYLCVCYWASCYIPPYLYVESRVQLGFLCCSQRIVWILLENALFKSFGEICWPPLPSLLIDEFSMDKRDSDSFFSRRLACRTNDRSYSSTDSSLVTVDYQQSFLACCVAKLLIRHVHGHAAYYIIVCNCTCTFLWLL